MKRTGLKLDVSASAVELDGPVGKAAKMQEQLFLQAVSECDEFPSFTKRSYPCWVMSLTQLRAFNELPQHEGTAVPFNPNSLISMSIIIKFIIQLSLPNSVALMSIIVDFLHCF